MNYSCHRNYPEKTVSANVLSVSEVQPIGWIWAKVRSTVARYALLYAVSATCSLN